MEPYYSKKLIKRFSNPKNFGLIKDADAVGSAGNPKCGDIMKLYIKTEKKPKKEVIKNVKFHTLGCAAAIATSDVICDLIKGKTLKEAAKVSYKDVMSELDYLPAVKKHCSFLAEQALKDAIKNYSKNEGKKSKKK